MPLGKKALVGAALLLLAGGPLANAHGNGNQAGRVPDLIQTCKDECPDVKNSADAMACAERLEKGGNGVQFRDSKCYQAQEKWRARRNATEETAGRVTSKEGS